MHILYNLLNNDMNSIESYMLASNQTHEVDACRICLEPIEDRFVKHENHNAHIECLRDRILNNESNACFGCSKQVDASSLFTLQERCVMQIQPLIPAMNAALPAVGASVAAATALILNGHLEPFSRNSDTAILATSLPLAFIISNKMAAFANLSSTFVILAGDSILPDVSDEKKLEIQKKYVMLSCGAGAAIAAVVANTIAKLALENISSAVDVSPIAAYSLLGASTAGGFLTVYNDWQQHDVADN